MIYTGTRFLFYSYLVKLSDSTNLVILVHLWLLILYYGVPFVAKFRILWTWIKILVFTKLTDIYDRIAIYILVFMHHTGIYAWYWYLRTILVFTHYTDIIIYAPYWYLQMILVVTRDTGIYARYWYLWMILVFKNDTDIYVRY